MNPPTAMDHHPRKRKRSRPYAQPATNSDRQPPRRKQKQILPQLSLRNNQKSGNKCHSTDIIQERIFRQNPDHPTHKETQAISFLCTVGGALRHAATPQQPKTNNRSATAQQPHHISSRSADKEHSANRYHTRRSSGNTCPAIGENIT